MRSLLENETSDERRRLSSMMFGSWRRTIAIVIWSLIGLSGGIVLLRRVAGAFGRELDGAEYFLVMFVVATLLILSFILAAGNADEQESSRRPRTILGLFLLTILVAALQPLGSAAGWLTSIAAVAGCCAVAWSPLACLDLGRQFFGKIEEWLPELLPPIPPTLPNSRVENPESDRQKFDLEKMEIKPAHPEYDSDETDAGITLELVRRNTPNGISIEGAIQVEFAAGLKQTNVHIPFVPSLQTTEQATCLCSGDGVEVQLSALFPYGMRLEARRSSPLAPLTTTIHFELRVPN